MHKRFEFCENDDIRSYNKATQIIDIEMSDREEWLGNNEKGNQAWISILIIKSWERITRNWQYRQFIVSCLKKEWYIY